MATLREAADVAGIKIRTARKWVALGKIKAEKDAKSKRLVISDSEIERLRHDYKDREYSK